MSRIEKALEKAAYLRNQYQETEPPFKPAETKERISFPGEVRINSPYIVTTQDPDSPISEEYRKLKSILVKMTKQEGFQNMLLVTSAMEWEGKTITAMNIAVSLAQEYDYTVLLIDADLRRPTLHEFMDINPEAGLADCLLNEADLSDVLIKTGVGKLVFLPAGKRVKDPAELLSSGRMRELVYEIKHRYADRYIIIDTPPILSFAETHALSSMVDGILFVVKAGMASVEHIQSALDMLKQSNLLGIIYNDVEVYDFPARGNTRAGHRYGT